MKKFLIILTFFFSTIFVIDIVNAEEVVHVNVDYDSTYVSGIIERLSDKIEIANELANYYKSSQRYSIILTEYRVYFILYESATITQVRSIFDGGANNKLDGKPNNTSYKYIELMYDKTYDLDSLISSLDSKSYSTSNYWFFFNSSTYIYGNSVPRETFNLYQYSSENYSSFSSSIIYDTNLDNIEIISSDYFLPISFNDGDILYEGDSFLTYTQVMDTTPKINITKENQTTVTIENETYISSITLNIEFSSINNDKYLYMYKYGIDSDWTTLMLTQSNSISKTFSTNDTLYVQVMDKITQETVSAATYTIDNINYNFEPYVDFNETVPTACSFYKNGRSYTICKDINVSAKNLQDGNYIASYSFNKTDWTNFVDTTISLNENKTIYFQIVNYLTNEVSYRSTYTVGNIDSDISELGVFNTYRSTYDKDTSFITAYINIYNLSQPVQDNYKIYYSFNSTSFNDITLLLNDMTNYYQYEINNINENKTIYFKITDLNDNILYTSTYTINYQAQATENSNFFTNFRTNFHGLSDIISTPLYAIKKLNKGVCSPLKIPIPYTNKNISLPCMTTVYENNMPVILNIWQIVTNGIISYFIILDLFRIVKSFKEPEEDKIEVVDL